MQAVQFQREVDDKKGLAMSSEAAAILATARGKLDRTATYLGVADRLRRDIAIPRRPVDMDELRDVETEAKAALGEEQFDIRYAAGGVMTPKQIVAYARVGDSTYRAGENS